MRSILSDIRRIPTDPITVTIVAALPTGVASGTTKVVESIIVNSYEALKSVLKKTFGQGSEVVKAIDSLEAKLDSAGRKETLKAAQTLVDQLRAVPGGEKYI
jgi:hypothetical protein